MFGLQCPLRVNLSIVTVIVESGKVDPETELLRRGRTGLLGKPALPHSEAAEPPAWQDWSWFSLLLVLPCRGELTAAHSLETVDEGLDFCYHLDSSKALSVLNCDGE